MMLEYDATLIGHLCEISRRFIIAGCCQRRGVGRIFIYDLEIPFRFKSENQMNNLVLPWFLCIFAHKIIIIQL